MKTIEDAKLEASFFCSWPKNPRALCFLWRCGDEDEMEDFAPLRLSAELVSCAVGFLLFLEAGEVRFCLAWAFSRRRARARCRSQCGRVPWAGGGGEWWCCS